jgi:hypothetical protein
MNQKPPNPQTLTEPEYTPEVRVRLVLGSRWMGLITLPMLLVACSYSVVPLVPQPLTRQQLAVGGLVLGAESGLERQQQHLNLRLAIRGLPQAGYLSVYLYRNDTQVAENSRYLQSEPQSQPQELILTLSEAQLGRYRAVVFWENRVIRQFELEIKGS